MQTLQELLEQELGTQTQGTSQLASTRTSITHVRARDEAMCQKFRTGETLAHSERELPASLSTVDLKQTYPVSEPDPDQAVLHAVCTCTMAESDERL